MASTKRWSYKTGERGRNRVRAFEEAKTGIIHLEWYETPAGSSTRKRRRKSLGHRDREKAKQQADEAAAAFAQQPQETPDEITLRELFDIYEREVTPEKSEREQGHDRTCKEMMLRFFGPERKAETLNRRDWDSFIRERSSGRLRPASKEKATAVGNRTVARDLKWLMAVFNWAVLAGDGQGGYLLKRNPLKGLPYPKEKNPSRPTVTQERYQAMLEVAGEVDWRFELALVLAHETGHRIGAIRRLQWSDVDLERRLLQWRGDEDKMGFEHETPLTDVAFSALRDARSAHPSVGQAWVFPAPGDPSEPCSRHLMSDWWKKAEEKAELEHIHGLGWHGLRRKFATELKEVPLKDLCHMGGWKTHRTILECYQKADMDSMREAFDQRQKLREAASG